MRTILMQPSTGLSSVLLSAIAKKNPEGQEFEKKYQHYINAREEVLPTSHRKNDSC